MIGSQSKLIVVAAFLIQTSSLMAIVIRHDQPDTKYLELGKKYPAAGSLLPDGTGVVTLIAPRWAITAAHVTKAITPFTSSVRFGEKIHQIDRVYRHPQYTEGIALSNVDLALIRLTSPVDGVTPAIPYTEKNEVGRQVTFVGWGDTGTGRSGPVTADGKLRGATNQVSGLVQDHWLTFVFDAPPDGTELEGISGPGDSGGPAFMEIDGQLSIVGVGCFNRRGSDGELCRYGSTEFYIRVSSFSNWIGWTLAGNNNAFTSIASVSHVSESGWPQTRVGQVVSAYFEALGGTDEQVLAFETSYRAKHSLARRSAEQRVDTWRQDHVEWGELRPISYASLSKTGMAVLVKRLKDDTRMVFRFRLEADPPHGLVAMMIMD